MDIKLELLADGITDAIKNNLRKLKADADEIADSAAIKTLTMIRDEIDKDESDAETIRRIKAILKSSNISYIPKDNKFYYLGRDPEEFKEIRKHEMALFRKYTGRE
ncbi:MAG: hypothetical protein IJH37_10190 [Clostridia bacterium]|nr:hypothetical protein [Clostridia bacterium]